MKKITILIPVYNEVNTLDKILEKVEQTNFCGLEKEIILFTKKITINLLMTNYLY